MKYIKYTVGFILGVLFVYAVGALVSWDFNPGEWSGFWRFLCVGFAILWGHVGGIVLKDYRKKIAIPKDQTWPVFTINKNERN